MDRNPSQRPLVWLVGDVDHPYFADADAWLSAACDCSRVPPANEQPSDPAGAIVFFQSRPGSISVEQVEAQHRRAPFARLILLTGPWCDGELRSSRVAPGVVRIRWHEWRQRLPAELTIRPHRLPRTATDIERLESRLRELSRESQSQGRIAICTSDRTKFGALAATCIALGCQASWVPPDDASAARDCDLLLLDGWDSLSANRPSESTDRRALLLAFPRPEDLQRAADHGVPTVIAEPISLPILAATLAAAAPHIADRPVQQSVA
jgi:hypothetical protein